MPSDETQARMTLLMAYVLNELPVERKAALETELAANAKLRGELAQARALLTLLTEHGRDAANWEVNASQRRRLHALLADRDVSWLSAAAERAREWIACLVYDSASPQAAVGLRGATRERHLIYQFDQGELDLRFSPLGPYDAAGSPQRVELLGQVSGPSAFSSAVLRRRDAQALEAPLDADGVFDIALEPGEYELTLQGAERAIVIPVLEISGAVG